MPPPQTSNASSDNSNDGLWGMLLFVAAIFILWFVAKGFIIGAVFSFRSYVSGPLIALFDAEVKASLEWMSSIPYSQVSYQDFAANGAIIGRYTQIPAMLLCFAMGVYIFFKHPAQNFKRRWDMFSLAKKEVVLWPCITPALNADLLKAPLEQGRWAWSTTPREWVEKHNLWESYQVISEISGLPENKRRLNPEAARHALIKQLGPKLTSLDNLPPYLKALMGAFMAKMCGDKKSASKILNQLSSSSAAVGVSENDTQSKLDLDKFNCKLGLTCFERYKSHQDVVAVLQKHAYLATAMLALLDRARSNGVLASAEFLWLKPVNRTLFYMFNALGRRTYWVDSAGIFAHYLAELQAGKKVERPYVETAIDGLNSYLQDYLDKPGATY